jgi:hypothetical protein
MCDQLTAINTGIMRGHAIDIAMTMNFHHNLLLEKFA